LFEQLGGILQTQYALEGIFDELGLADAETPRLLLDAGLERRL
jgi:hypothetical protein